MFAFAMATAIPAFAAPAVGGASAQTINLADFAILKQSAQWCALRAKLKRWKDLPDDWDGDDGVAPTHQTIETCYAFLEELENVEAPLPTATVAGDGEITYEWARDAGFASASFTADGDMILFLREAGVDTPLRMDEQFDLDAMSPFLERIGAFA